MCDVSQASISAVVRVYIKPEGSIAVALVLLALPSGPTILPESLDVPQHLQKVLKGQAPVVWKCELWLEFLKGVCSASPLKYSWLESLKLLPRMGKTDGQTKNPSLLLIWSSIIWHEELAAV